MFRLNALLMTLTLCACACTSDPVSPPVFDPSAIASNSLAIADQVTCMIRADGVPYCFGSSYPTDAYVPGDGALRFVQISGSWQHFCALTSEGEAYCWGVNLYGELGDGTRARRDQPNASGIDTHTPTRVLSDFPFTAINAGVYSTCALDANGSAWCWGNNWTGQLGNGSTSESEVATVPQKVSGSERFASIEGAHVYCATETSGGTSCWGQHPGSTDPNFYVQPGHCTNVFYIFFQGRSCLTPTGLGGAHAMSVTSGGSCGLDRVGRAWCWGNGEMGQLGDGRIGAYSVLPVAVVGDHEFSSVAAGPLHVCALDTEGKAWCWGSNTAGQLGIGTDGLPNFTPRYIPVPQAVLTDERFVELAADSHTCGLTADRRLFCWGLLAFGNRPVERSIP